MKQIGLLVLVLLALSGCKQNNLEKANKLYQKRDFTQALFHYEKACLEGEIYACKMSAFLHQEGKHSIPMSKAKAIKALEFACQYGDLPSCKITLRAYNLLHLKDLSQKVLGYSCQGGDATSCLQLAQTLYNPKDYKPSLELATKSCYGGEKRGCKLAIALLERFEPKSSSLNGLQKQLELLLQS
ncbi:sel1 repeat family protein [Helicobacter brantae]|uniref:Beta-lactamase n=1 Tax=Helicobacter brantae TaxID=375927 RepID=A0A3D8IZ42_9HELI|nr:sel1 repeat family protein [Helicobacter brantae]RDU70539.1 hypothetical protein CQA58_05040 [Helicobacter brantae]